MKMKIYKSIHEDNAELSRALIPKAEIAHLMRGGSHSKAKAVPTDLARELTRMHEAGHAVFATVLRGFYCEYVTIERSEPSAMVRTLKGDACDGNEDLIDLAGLFSELRYVGTELGYCHAHLKSATHDLDKARSRLEGTEAQEVAWAKKYQPLGEEAVVYFWGMICSLASRLLDNARLNQQQIEFIVRNSRPSALTPSSLKERVKAEYLIT